MVSSSSIAKSALRIVLEGSWGAFFRRAIMCRETKGERLFVAAQAKKASTVPLSREGLASLLEDKPSAKTFFVLGSGASINRLSAANFEEIGANRSVGINTWPIHSFIPDFYSFECVSWIGDGLDFSRSLGLLHRKDVQKARPPLVVLRLKTEFELEQLAGLPEEFKDRLFFYGRVAPATREVSNLVADLEFLLKSFSRRGPFVVADSGSSIVRMVALGISMGYREIVLTGVDLNNAPYFWQENSEYDAARSRFPIFSRQVGATHETLERGHRPFIVTEMVSALAEVIDSRYDGKLFVSTGESTLADFLPVYPWG